MGGWAGDVRDLTLLRFELFHFGFLCFCILVGWLAGCWLDHFHSQPCLLLYLVSYVAALPGHSGLIPTCPLAYMPDA